MAARTDRGRGDVRVQRRRSEVERVEPTPNGDLMEGTAPKRQDPRSASRITGLQMVCHGVPNESHARVRVLLGTTQVN